MLKDDGSPVIIDFGLSKQYDMYGSPESSSTIGLGTPGYAPIEQANQRSGKSFQPTIDIYALGATLYKMLTGHTPPLASEVINEGFPAAELQAHGVSEGTIDAIRKAMSVVVKERFQTVVDFLYDLDGASVLQGGVDSGLEADSGPDSSPDSDTDTVPVPGRISQSDPWIWKLVACLLLAVMGVILVVKVAKRNKIEPTPQDPLQQTQKIIEEWERAQEPIPTGSLRVNSDPAGATIWLDGLSTNKRTPSTFDDFVVGTHSVKMTLEGYKDYKTIFRLTSEQQIDISCKLEKIEGTVQAPGTSSSGSTTARESNTEVVVKLDKDRAIVGSLPVPSFNTDDWHTGFVIVVRIKVDQNGEVVEADPGVVGTTVTYKKLWDLASEAAKKTKFEKVSDSSLVQIGTIIYKYAP